MEWIGEVVDAEWCEELATSESVLEKFPDFEVLDSTIAGGFRTMIAANFKRQVAAEESTI